MGALLGGLWVAVVVLDHFFLVVLDDRHGAERQQAAGEDEFSETDAETSATREEVLDEVVAGKTAEQDL